MKNVTIQLYSFNELSQQAKEKAIMEHRMFLESMPVSVENEEGELVDEYEQYDDDAAVIDNIEANEYLFFQDGSLAHCTTYTGKHEKAGITEFHFHGITYDITK